MEARDLEYFIVVAESGNLRRAADALNLSQPALSKSIRRLEQSAGTKLVKGTPRGIELTAAGVVLLSHARRLRLSFDEIVRELRGFTNGTTGHVRVGCAPVQMSSLLCPACIELHRQCPDVSTRIAIAGNDELMLGLRRGDLDLAICGIRAPSPKDLTYEPLYEDRMVVCAAARHRVAGRKKVSITDLAGEQWALPPSGTLARAVLNQALDSAGIGPPNIAMESASIRPRLRLIASSNVIGYMAWSDAQEVAAQLGIVELPVTELRATRLAGVVHRNGAYLSPAAERLIDIVKATARDLAKSGK